jgi:hypothetical protein
MHVSETFRTLWIIMTGMKTDILSSRVQCISGAEENGEEKLA